MIVIDSDLIETESPSFGELVDLLEDVNGRPNFAVRISVIDIKQATSLVIEDAAGGNVVPLRR